MKTLRIIKSVAFILCTLTSCIIYSQVYSAKDGAFVVFQEKAEKEIECTFPEKEKNIILFGWPRNLNDFIKSYRASELIFSAPFPMTDQDLINYWTKLNDMDELAFVVQYHPVMLMALGQAAFIADDYSRKEYAIELIHSDKSKTAIVLKFRDHMLDTHLNTKFENGDDEGINIQMKLTMPKDCWVRSARIYKKAVGGKDSTEIFPFIFATQMHDRVQMNIRDTTKQVGEFIYSIHPTDLLGNLHPGLKGAYVQNYNTITAPRVINFNSYVPDHTKSVKLSWQCSVPERVRGFEIYRGSEIEGPFKRIASLEASDSVYIDNVNGVMQAFYYFVQIIDQTGERINSITQFVTPLLKEKPMSPPEITAESVNGGIRISWPTYDALHLIRGYYVYRRDRDTSSWSQVSNFLDKKGSSISFTDTSSTLQSEMRYTYAVKSESTSYELSDFSVHTSARPDKSRNVMTPDQLEWRRLDDGHLMLYWNDERIKDPSISYYHIFASDANGNPTKEMPNSPVNAQLQYWINAALTENEFGYCIQSEDAWGNKSTCSHPVKPLWQSSIATPGIILVHPIATGYHLTWGVPTASSVKSILLYEVKENNETTLVKTFTPLVHSYDILPLKGDQIRSFYLAYQSADGKESDRGDVVVINR
ncbi:MAG: fibronectin type III domain-containing protein [Saprospiraceae bacterium]